MTAAATAMTTRGAGRARADTNPDKPNILIVVVDEMRSPQWFPDQATLNSILPNTARIRRGAVSFEQHYAAANDCTPARGTMLTGLYAHQTGCLLTSQATLPSQFPTWGSMIRDQGYQTWWWGKWHLGHDGDTRPSALEDYGFSGGTYPSPNGGPGQGMQMDPKIVDQFVDWFDTAAANQPWCTTVSLINPHDVQCWPRWTRQLQTQRQIPRWMTAPPPNFESLDQLSRKPRLQRALIDISAIAFGIAPYGTPDAADQWTALLNLYLWLQQQVDLQIGRVLDALEARPDVARNTVIVFTSDHGDYAGSHGLHGKGGAAYDEAIRVPLYVHDPRGYFSPTDGTGLRGQLTSSVDLAPLLLTIATGGGGWRGDDQYAHLTGRYDLAAMCRNASEPGRPWIAHTTDENSIEEAAVLFEQSAPGHVVAVRTAEAKYASYSHWVPGEVRIDTGRDQEYELYDYSTRDGALELDNRAGDAGPLRDRMSALHAHAIDSELHQPLPAALRAAQDQGWADYQDAVSKPIGEQLFGPVLHGGG
ncbi:sulfatase-like hydrolase/transferase [Nocardia tengchongensis]|uniref:Sulfatase-like hydrolase/transferase n=1 Tax=Nocardia tengchongensis TaxID=2055889 RepID=A0ABX8D0N4_9NOCA|nr:sulfatase-like hydrolase/transferase [Nocardia tengchongensis]